MGDLAPIVTEVSESARGEDVSENGVSSLPSAATAAAADSGAASGRKRGVESQDDTKNSGVQEEGGSGLESDRAMDTLSSARSVRQRASVPYAMMHNGRL
jgi:hypothetical protein